MGHHTYLVRAERHHQHVFLLQRRDGCVTIVFCAGDTCHHDVGLDTLGIDLETAGALQLGTLIHAWFEQIEWLDDEEEEEAASFFGDGAGVDEDD